MKKHEINTPDVVRRGNRIFWASFAFGAVFMLLFILYYTLLSSDVANTYGKMVHQFGLGRYKHAFYPGIPPLLIILAGIVAKVGGGGYTALKITCALFFLATLFPLRAIMRRCLPDDLASWTCLIYVISFYLVKNVVWGLPFALKMFFLVYGIYLIIRFAETSKIKYIILLGISTGLLALARGEGIFFLPFFLFWFIVLPYFRRFRKNNITSAFHLVLKQLLGIVIIFSLFTIICLPQMIYIYHHTGIPMTEARVAEAVKGANRLDKNRIPANGRGSKNPKRSKDRIWR